MNLRTLSVMLVSLYTTRVVMSNLGIIDFGIFNVVAGFVVLFSFLNNSLAVTSQRFYNYSLGKGDLRGLRNVYIASWHIHFFLAIIIIVTLECAGLFYINNYLVVPASRLYASLNVFQSCVVSLFFLMLSVPYSSAIMAHEKMDIYAWIGILDSLLKLLIAFLIELASQDKLIIYGWLLCLISVADFFLYYGYAKSKFPEISLNFLSFNNQIRPMLSFTSWGILGTLSYLVREQGTNLVINLFCGPIVNAARGIANQINGAINGVISNIVIPARPQIIQSYAQGDISRSISLSFGVSKMMFVFFYMIVLPISMQVSSIMSIWLGDNVPQYTDWFVILMFVASLFGVLLQPLSALMHANGNIRFYQITGCITNIISIPLVFLFLYFLHEPYYAFVALIISSFLNYLVGVISVMRVMPFSLSMYLRRVVMPVLIHSILCLSLAKGLLLLFSGSWISILLFCFCCILFVGILGYIIVLSNNERVLINQFVLRFVSRHVHER